MGDFTTAGEVESVTAHEVINNNGYKSPPAISSMPKPKKPQGRVSLLAKLHKKQAEIAQRSVKKERQAVAENDMEREQK